MADIINFSDWKNSNAKNFNDLIHESISLNKKYLISVVDESENNYEVIQNLELFSQKLLGLFLKRESIPPEDLIDSLASGNFYTLISYIKERTMETPFVKEKIKNKFQ